MAHGRIHPLTLAALGWGAFIVYGTCLPFDFSGDLGSIGDSMDRLLRELDEPQSLPDVLSNVLLFIPWGGLVAAATLRGGSSRGGSLAAAVLTGVLLSGCVEILQLLQPQRTPSLSDVMYNAAGSLAGALLAMIVIRKLWRPCAALIARAVVKRPLACVATLAVVWITLAGLQPFSFSIDVGDLAASVKSARVVPFGDTIRGSQVPYPWWKWAGDLLAWSLVGGTVALAFGERVKSTVSAVVGATLAGGVVAGSIEVMQLVLPRGTDATTVAFALGGSAAGALVVGAIGLRRPRNSWGPAVAVWLGMLVVSAWTPPPYTWPESFSWLSLVPFLGYYTRMDLNAVADLIRQSAVMVPFGAFLAFRIPSLRIGAAVVGLIVGSILEVGQLFVAARTADATDAITAAIGAMIGSILWRRSTSARSTAVAASSPEVRTRRELDRAIARRRAGDDSVAAK